MNPTPAFRYLLLVAIVATLSACGSSSSEISEPGDMVGTGSPSGDTELPANVPATIDDEPAIDEGNAGDDTGEQDAGEPAIDEEGAGEQDSAAENNAGQGSGPDEGSEAQTDESVAVGDGGTDVGNVESGVSEQAPDGSTTDDPEVPFDQTDDPDSVDEPDPFDQEDTSGVLIPPVVPGSDLERVVRGLTRQAASTLLDLNQRITQGETLTAQQEQCLGAFEEGFGEPLLAVNCDQPLATGDVELWVGEAAFFDTAACRRSLSSQASDGCVLERLTLTIRSQFTPSANGNGPPRLAFPGALLSYGINEPTLTLQNIDSALTGVFSCSVSLETAAIAGDSAVPGGCNQRIESIANEIERLQNASTGD